MQSRDCHRKDKRQSSMFQVQKEDKDLKMVKPRTPRPIYRQGAVMEFRIINNEINYKISLWSKDGFTQGDLEQGKLNDQDPNKVFDNALQKFRKVMDQ